MEAVQSLRALARAHGNLVTTEHQEVVVDDRYIRIVPAHPRIVYVPTYDPYVVYHRPIVHLGVYRDGWSFGIGFPIGAWLSYGLDWRRHHVFYHGWDPYFHRVRWIHRSRPFIVINRVYVRPRPRVVVVNRRVINRYVDYRRFDRYRAVHRQVVWDRRDRQDARRYAERKESWRADDRGARTTRTRSPSWDRSGRLRTVDADRQAVERAATRQSAVRRPSWDRSARVRTNDDDRRAVERAATRQSTARSPSWDRSARVRTNDDDRRAAERAATTSRTRQSAARSSSWDRSARVRTNDDDRRAAVERARRSVESRSQPRRVEQQRARPNRVEIRQRRPSSRPQVERSRARSAPSRAQRSEARSSGASRSERKSTPKRSGGRGRGSR